MTELNAPTVLQSERPGPLEPRLGSNESESTVLQLLTPVAGEISNQSILPGKDPLGIHLHLLSRNTPRLTFQNSLSQFGRMQ